MSTQHDPLELDQENARFAATGWLFGWPWRSSRSSYWSCSDRRSAPSSS